MTTPCLTEDEVLALVAGELGDPGRALHLDDCEPCRQCVSLLAGGTAGRPRFFAGQPIGRFVLVRPLGMGGMGVVFEADDPVLARKVALKLLRVDAADRGAAEARLVRESRALAQLNHPNVVTLYDVGRHGDELYLAMELVEGTTLADWLTATHDWRDVVDAFVAAGRGLAAAHAIGLVHRDVKPENMLVGIDGRVRIGDFGVVGGAADTPGIPSPGRGYDRLRDRASSSALTAPGAAVGTPRYMAPEVWGGKPATVASDQWSFAASIWRALSGSPAGEGTPKAPRKIADVLRRALATEPTARWPSLGALLDALQPRRRRVVWISAATAVIGAAVTVAATTLMSGSEPAIDPCADVAAELDGVWDPGRRFDVDQHYRQLGTAAASATGKAVERDLDRYTGDWLAARRAACRSGTAGAPLQVACLARKLAAVRATVDSIARSSARPAPTSSSPAKPSSPTAGLDAVETLPPIDECTSAEHLVRGEQLPSDPEARRAVAAATVELDAAEARWRLDEDDSVLAIAKRAADAGKGYAPLRARALDLVADVQRLKLDPAAVPTLHEAAAAAAEAGDDVLQARIALQLVDTNVIAPRDARERDWELQEAGARIVAVSRFAPTTAERLRQYWLRNRAALELERKDFPAGVRDFREACALTDKEYGADSWQAARMRGALTTALILDGDFDLALHEIERSLPIVERHLEPNNPELAKQYIQAAAAYHFVGNEARAVELSDRAMTIAAHAPVGLQMAVLEMQADIQMSLGDLARGVAILDRELELHSRSPGAANQTRLRTRVGCARQAIAAAAERSAANRESQRTRAAECFLADLRPAIAVPLLERGLATTANSPPDLVAVRERFALARGLGGRGRAGDDQRAIDEATRARRDCDRVHGAAALAREIDAWLVEARN